MNTLAQVTLIASAAVLGYCLGHFGSASKQKAASRQSSAVDAPKNGGLASSTNSRETAMSRVGSALLAHGDLHDLARLSELLETLDADQMRQIMDTVDRQLPADRERLLPGLLGYWTKRDPKAATEWFRPRLVRFARSTTFGRGFADLSTELDRMWAENAPELAIDFARQIPGTKLAEITLHNAIFAMRGADERQFEVLRSFPAGEARTKVTSSFFFTWAQTDGPRALSAAAGLPAGEEREAALSQVLARIASSDPAATLRQAAELGIATPGLLAVTVMNAARRDAKSTAEWLTQQSPEMVADLGALLSKSWAAQDPSAAFAWALANGISLTDTGGKIAAKLPRSAYAGDRMEVSIDSPFGAALREKPDATLAWITALPAGPDRERYLELAFRSGADPGKLQPLLQQLSPESAALAAAQIAKSLGWQSSAKAQAWIQSLPPGAMRQEAWTAFGSTRSEPVNLPPGPDRDAMLRGLPGQTVRTSTHTLELALPIGR